MSDRSSVFSLSYTVLVAFSGKIFGAKSGVTKPGSTISGGRLFAAVAVTFAGVLFIAGCNAITLRPSDRGAARTGGGVDGGADGGAITDSGWGAPPPVAVPQGGEDPLDAPEAERLVNQFAEGSFGGSGGDATNPLYTPTPSAAARPTAEATGVIWDEPGPASRPGLGTSSNPTPVAGGSSPSLSSSGGVRQAGPSTDKRSAEDAAATYRSQTPHVRSASIHEATSSPHPPDSSESRIGSGSSAVDLFEELAALIESGNDDDLVKAVRLDALSLVDPGAGRALRARSDPAANLNAEQKKIAELYRDVIRLIGEEISGTPASPGPGTLAELKARFDALNVADPLAVKRAELCRSVRGFGVYDPFESNTFVAGRNQPMIIYLELENFESKPVNGTDQEVKLTQEVEIYNKADGLLVWQKKPDQIVDRSRNRRRDFFTVQMMELPARLTVGQFTIKVRVTDHHGNAIDETNIPLNMVADRSLTSSIDSVLK